MNKKYELHGMRNTTEYGLWYEMKRRCFDEKRERYKDYGGRGITVCKRWLKFSNFIKDMGLRPSKEHSLERINNNKNYNAENCKWATAKEQSSNTRRNVFLEYNNEKLTLKQWAEKLGINYQTLYKRYRSGWDTKRILTN